MKTLSQIEINNLLECYQKGELESAEKLARLMIKNFPNDQVGWKALGVILKKAGRVEEALVPMQKSVELIPKDSEALNNLGATLKELGRLEDAEIILRKSIALQINYSSAHTNLGNVLQELGRLEEAEKSHRKAIELNPSYALAHNNLGNSMRGLGRLEDAEICYKKAIELHPDYAQAYGNLGITLKDLGKLEEAETSHRKAISLNPNLAEAHSNLGVTLKDLGKLEEAEVCHRRAIALSPNHADAYSNLGSTLLESNNLLAALDAAICSIKIKKTIAAKNLFIESIKKIIPQFWDLSLSKMVISALLEPWGRPSELMTFATNLIKTDTELMQCIDKIVENTHHNLFDENKLINSLVEKEFKSSLLLNAALTSSHIADIKIELFCTALRRHLLQVSTSINLQERDPVAVSSLYCALAQQCFINEYVYFETPEETKNLEYLLDKLKKALEADQEVSPIWIVAISCYLPLHSVSGANKLLQKYWPSDVKAVLELQIEEPLQELSLRSSIPCLTSIDNRVSLEVKNQYEQNPYPRWIRLPKESRKFFLNTYIQRKFPLTTFQPLADDTSPKILIAGSGTGQHPIGTAQQFEGAKILAVDLSMASLSYAKRKTIELGIKSIDYAQADLLKLAKFDNAFDLVESAGVLHHLEDPFHGWEVLLSMLKPHGLMLLGFYSTLARRDIIRVRRLIARDGISSSVQDIRHYRQYLLSLNCSENYGFAISSNDFFSTSDCRDLLFHVQEQQMTLYDIAKFLEDHNLNFLGFEIDRYVIQAYKRRFPNDPSATNLKQWHVYEKENPDTFIGMYQFWIQKNL